MVDLSIVNYIKLPEGKTNVPGVSGFVQGFSKDFFLVVFVYIMVVNHGLQKTRHRYFPMVKTSWWLIMDKSYIIDICTPSGEESDNKSCCSTFSELDNP